MLPRGSFPWSRFPKAFVFTAALILPIASSALARQIAWQSPIGRTNITSSTNLWDTDFRFELGVFQAGFVPSATNTSQWAANWVPAQRTRYQTNRSFASTYTVTNNLPPQTNNAKPYIWGFRGSELSGEWILITRSTWLWPTADNTQPTILLSTGPASAVVGTLNTNTNAPFHLQSAAVTNVSPPSTPWPQWATENLGTVPPAGGSGDLNTNGITDVLEYALHLNPGERPNPGAWLQIGQTNGNRHLEVRIPRRRDRPATFVVEVSTNLVQWTNGPTFTEIVEDSAAALVVRDTTPIGEGGDRRFLRVRTIATP